MRSEKIFKHTISFFALSFLLFLAIGSGDNGGSETGSDYSSSEQWFEGGNLHNATIAQWETAKYSNKLATAGDWLAATLWKGHLNTADDFTKLKVKAQMLVEAVNGAIPESGAESLQASEIAGTIIIMSNDLGPN